MSGTAPSKGGPSPADFRSPEYPADRALALEAVIDAKGRKLPKPPVCHGKANCCRCPACDPTKHNSLRRRNARVDPPAARAA